MLRVRLGRQQVVNFLNSNRIFHREHGAGVQKGNVYINCPFCEHADSSQAIQYTPPLQLYYGPQ